ncbi:ATP-binding protein [Streptomyces sp. NPDC093801]|uniref:ATP-binding protein n=1 Tax=Streptomyces sp. NPDC093801 TaxID=3155203 RepID=UPI00345019FD
MTGALAEDVKAAPTGPQRYSDGYTPRDTAPARARRDVTLCLRTWGLDALVDDARLIVSELVANAVQHTASRRIGVSVTRHPDHVRIVVTDTSRTLPDPATHTLGGEAESGRGLQLVDQFATRWGSKRFRTGKQVWAELTTGKTAS